VTIWEFQNLQQEGHAGKCGVSVELFGGFSTMLYASPTEKELRKYKRDSGESLVRFLIQFL
jgi:hypothetical protein